MSSTTQSRTTAKMDISGAKSSHQGPSAGTHQVGNGQPDAGRAPSYGASAWRYLSLVGLLHVLAISGLLLSFHNHPGLIGLGLLAYSFGLRHAFDIDHIAAIDNTVRKLTRDRTNPNGTGFFFSLGHSTVVFVLAVLASLVAGWVHHSLPRLSSFGNVLGACVSGGFLLLIGLVNVPSLYSLLKNVRARYVHEQGERGKETRQGHPHHRGDLSGAPGSNQLCQTVDDSLDATLDDALDNRGFFFRFIGKRLGFIRRSWHIYPVGVLFGLGFDTATEVALLVMSGTLAATVQNMQFSLATVAYVVTLPLLFTAGMSLMDTLDGLFMSKTYSWALHNSRVQLYYNAFLTAITVFTALGIGLLEFGQVISETIGFKGLFWEWLDALSFGQLGLFLTGIFAISAVMVYVYLRRQQGKLRERMS